MKKLDSIIQKLTDWPEGTTAGQLAEQLGLDRSTVSRYLNQLVKQGQADKIAGRPVLYRLNKQDNPYPFQSAHAEMTDLLREALAALLYPPHGLPILLTGETGVGKTHLAQKLVQLATNEGHLPPGTPFITFNCAEYAQNPELLLAQLFGVKKGAYTGAEENKPGLVERADQGILFLDEIHRLPPSGQEMLFTLIDQGSFRRLGETHAERQVNIRLIGATTETPDVALLPTLKRRFSVRLVIPPLRERSPREREQLLATFLKEEESQMGLPLTMTDECRSRFLAYDCPGNIGQLKSDIQIACARAFLRQLYHHQEQVVVTLNDLPTHLRQQGPVTTAITSHLKRTASDNIYELLLQRHAQLTQQAVAPLEMERELQETVNSYIRRLVTSFKKGASHEPEGTPIEPRLLQLLENTLASWPHKLPQAIAPAQLKALALHIQAFIQQPERHHPETVPSHLPVKPIYKDLARQIGHALKQHYHIKLPEAELDLIALFFSLDEQPSRGKPRCIATVCLTGEGAASTLESWLSRRLPPADRDVLIRSVQIDPFTRQSPGLEHLRETFDLIAIVGTVPPAMSDIPYFPAWELYQPSGFSKLERHLAQTRQVPGEEEPQVPLTPEDVPELILQGLLDTITHYNPKRLIQLVEQEAPQFRNVFGWTAEREIGIWMHIGIYADQLLAAQLNPGKEKDKQPLPPEAEPPTGHVQLWEHFLQQLEQCVSVRFPPYTAHELARLSAAN
ncbi:sigma 54-interacting transcriptional regulator [Laceyella putida]|uniref:Sigma 54-interacting transcriptional regulator n=1 Tax=Laceyella putida TaxID=110101 RepID=A0ABW2RFY8_9BACL